jgi:vitamin B12/bleomycin/antimicrobial peptide transport system ATP-binding/permease protein
MNSRIHDHEAAEAASGAPSNAFSNDAQTLPPTAEGPDEIASKRRYLLRRFWRAALGFWGRKGMRAAWSLSATILANLGALYGINVWNRALFDGLEKHNSQSVLFLSLIYFPIMVASVLFSVTQVYGRMTLQRRWRAWLNDHLIERWLSGGRYYHLNLVSGDHENPEFRIADDVRQATESPVDFVTGVTSAAALGNDVRCRVVDHRWDAGVFDCGTAPCDPGLPGCGRGHLRHHCQRIDCLDWPPVRAGVGGEESGRSRVPLHVDAASRERREHALIRGEEEERAGVERSLGKVLAAWRSICIQHMKTTVVSQTSGYIAPILPVILCAPKYLDGSLTLGQVMQAASAFTIVQAAFNWLVDNYPKLAEWTASARRVASLMVALDALEAAENGDAVSRIEITEGRGEAALRLVDLSVTLDDGTAVVDEAEVSVMSGERVLIAGESGTGKSTLVRAIAGLWPWGEGRIEVRKGAKVFFLPQRPYIPLGTLRRAATYPDDAESRSVEEVAEAFRHVGLDQLVDRLDEEGPWDQTLSGGEKQRLAFARVFLHSPDIIVLDEATAALDPQSQDRLMAMLVRQPERTTLISVGHSCFSGTLGQTKFEPAVIGKR